MEGGHRHRHTHIYTHRHRHRHIHRHRHAHKPAFHSFRLAGACVHTKKAVSLYCCFRVPGDRVHHEWGSRTDLAESYLFLTFFRSCLAARGANDTAAAGLRRHHTHDMSLGTVSANLINTLYTKAQPGQRQTKIVSACAKNKRSEAEAKGQDIEYFCQVCECRWRRRTWRRTQCWCGCCRLCRTSWMPRLQWRLTSGADFWTSAPPAWLSGRPSSTSTASRPACSLAPRARLCQEAVRRQQEQEQE